MEFSRLQLLIIKSVGVVAILGLCFVGAGSPPLLVLVKPNVLMDAVSLRAITWHWMNRMDRTSPDVEVMASRFYILLMAVACLYCSWFSLKQRQSLLTILRLTSIALIVLVVLVYAQIQADYQVG